MTKENGRSPLIRMSRRGKQHGANLVRSLVRVGVVFCAIICSCSCTAEGANLKIYSQEDDVGVTMVTDVWEVTGLTTIWDAMTDLAGEASLVQPALGSETTDDPQDQKTKTFASSTDHAGSEIVGTPETPVEAGDVTGLGTWWYPTNWWSILQLLGGCVGTLGNSLVVFVLSRRRTGYSSSTDIFIGALAVADLVTSLATISWVIPVRGLRRNFNKVVVTRYLAYSSVAISVYTLMGMIVERVVAIFYPLRVRIMITPRRVTAFLTTLWVSSFSLHSLYLILMQVSTSKFSNKCYDDTTFLTSGSLPVLQIGWMSLQVIIPTVIIVVTHIAIAVSLHRQSRKFPGATEVTTTRTGAAKKPTYHIGARNRILKMMIIMVVVFIVTFFPFQGASIAWFRGHLPEDFPRSDLHRALNLLFYSGSFVNPFIYAATYPKFRTAIREMFSSGTHQNMPLFGA